MAQVKGARHLLPFDPTPVGTVSTGHSVEATHRPSGVRYKSLRHLTHVLVTAMVTVSGALIWHL